MFFWGQDLGIPWVGGFKYGMDGKLTWNPPKKRCLVDVSPFPLGVFFRFHVSFPEIIVLNNPWGK